AALLKELLHVRDIEGRDWCIGSLQILSDRANGFVAAEVTHDGNYQVPCLEVLHDLEILFAGQIASVLPLTVLRRHQAPIRRTGVSSPAATDSDYCWRIAVGKTGPIVDIGAEPIVV